MIHYYALRRVNPYLGMIQVIDTGAVRAYSSRGDRWQPRRVFDAGQFATASEASHHCGFELLPKDALLAAIHNRPALPFPQRDRYELWLLHRESGLPLALLRTCFWEHEREAVTDPTWSPFMPGSAHFQVVFLPRTRGASTDARHCQAELQQLVNFAARPQASTQWFLRQEDGCGLGLDGLRLDAGLVGRQLAAACFPQLLVDESGWPEAWQRELVSAFHASLAPQLLVHQGLDAVIRARLEQAAQRAPQRLLDTYRMIPELLDSEGMTVAMVTARLMGGSRHSAF
jgi:hypothetical protein